MHVCTLTTFSHLWPNSTQNQVGTNGYTAPEILKGEPYGTPADVFSFAIVMCELFTLRPPYSDIIKGGSDEERVHVGGELRGVLLLRGSSYAVHRTAEIRRTRLTS